MLAVREINFDISTRCAVWNPEKEIDSLRPSRLFLATGPQADRKRSNRMR
jgi:hypothetical protein